jgi:hypothetical protein
MKNVLFLLALITQTAWAQNQVPTLKAKSNKVSIRLGKLYLPDSWEATPKPKNDPEDIGFEVDKKGMLFSFITDKDSISFVIKQGEKQLFRIIINEKDTVWAEAVGRYPKANFDTAYKKANDGKVHIELPAVYELVNIIMAITPTGISDSSLIEHNMPYYTQVRRHFDPFKNHRAVVLMDSLLKVNLYYDIKMDAYSFEFKKGILTKKETYNRIAWGANNTIEKYILTFQEFAKTAKFEKFYKKNQPFYQQLIRTYRDTLGVAAMLDWLKKNFPTTRYNCTKIIFSHLVNANQSASSFENEGFKEAQAHVDFPNIWHNSMKDKYSAKGFDIRRGDILFTELNHSYENPELEENEQNLALFNQIKLNLSVFASKGTAAANGYSNPISCFEEYMNWALVSLRYVDFAPKEDLEAMLQYRENFMVNRRGFTQFKEFNRFLVDIYTKRPQGKVVADLYPQIIQWFAEHNK